MSVQRQAWLRYTATITCITVLGFGLHSACSSETPTLAALDDVRDAAPPYDAANDPYHGKRDSMVRYTIEARDIQNASVTAAMRCIPRHLFIPERVRHQAYADRPLPIGHDQTISQPYIVALMTELLELDGTEKVLEIGTGSGYQAAVLAEICEKVFSIEIVEPLAKHAAETLLSLGYDKVQVRTGDGYAGWPSEAPFQAIILTAAPPQIPQPLLDQLDTGGILVAPVGESDQWLVKVKRTEDGLEWRNNIPVRFVPMTGRAQREKD